MKANHQGAFGERKPDETSSANGGESHDETGTFSDWGSPGETLVVVAFEFELFDEHRIVSRLNKDPPVRLTPAS
jgi:hypothetical protein